MDTYEKRVVQNHKAYLYWNPKNIYNIREIIKLPTNYD
jgi:hypothetical protein